MVGSALGPQFPATEAIMAGEEQAELLGIHAEGADKSQDDDLLNVWAAWGGRRILSSLW